MVVKSQPITLLQYKIKYTTRRVYSTVSFTRPSPKIPSLFIFYTYYSSFVLETSTTSIKKFEDVFTNYEVTDVPYDGNCMFSAIALQIGQNVSCAMDIRLKIISHLREHPVRVLKTLFYCLVLFTGQVPLNHS